ncbi:MAG TPA: hypothetical protein VJJ81_00675 [Candidatus Babeliales bacterium]|nr:hypothetical protein [Candidatus Babeliales bacterium]
MKIFIQKSRNLWFLLLILSSKSKLFAPNPEVPWYISVELEQLKARVNSLEQTVHHIETTCSASCDSRSTAASPKMSLTATPKPSAALVAQRKKQLETALDENDALALKLITNYETDVESGMTPEDFKYLAGYARYLLKDRFAARLDALARQ